MYQPFLIWLALSWQARTKTFRKQLDNRRKLLEEDLSREKATLEDVMNEVGHQHHEAVWMIQLVIEQMQTELRWVERILRDADKRAPARNTRKE